jgi:GNAT superfamily N-acetyltransferase
METEDDKMNVLALGFENFKVKACSDGEVPLHAVRSRYEEFINQGFKNPHQCVYIAEIGGVFAGFAWVYVSQGDLGTKKYVLMQVTMVPGVQEQKVGEQLLAQAEQWTRAQKLDTVRTEVHAVNTGLMSLLTLKGYRKANLFMQKQIG